MENLAEKLILDIADDILEEDSKNENFVIESDITAEWALEKISLKTAESKRNINVLQSKIIECELRIKKEEQSLQIKISFLQEKLRQYFQKVTHEKTKTQESYKLPAGKLILKYPKTEYTTDEKKLGEFLASNMLDNFYELVFKPKWSELKKEIGTTLQRQGNTLVTEDGVIVDGVQVTDSEQEFEIKFK
jgi:phenylalanyl-tRNA synthetase alpha subunit